MGSATVELQQNDLVGFCENCGGYVDEDNIEIGPNAVARYCAHCDEPLRKVNELRESVTVDRAEFVNKEAGSYE